MIQLFPSESDPPRFLYRGFDPTRSSETAGGLQPDNPGQAFTYVFKAGETVREATGEVIKAGAGAVAGKAPRNAVLRHQSDHELGWRDSGISTTPFRRRAEYYATAGGKRPEGQVLVIDTKLLEIYKVRCYRMHRFVAVPSVPEDDEHILVANDCGVLPEAIVAERYDVSPPQPPRLQP